MQDVIEAPAIPRIAVRGGGSFPVRRIYCVGRNFADHAREMGASAPASKAERGTPVFFHKPADAVVTDGHVAYPPGTRDLHHEVELVVALGRDAPAGELRLEDAPKLVFGYAVGLDLTRRDLQAAAQAKGLPWDSGKGFDPSSFDNSNAELDGLRTGQVDVIVQDDPVVKGWLKDPANSKYEIVANLNTGEQYGFWIRKDYNKKLVELTNQAIEQAKRDGTYKKIYEKWIGPMPAAAGKPS